MSESLRNDGRIWVPKARVTSAPRTKSRKAERDYYLERMYPSFGNLVPRDVASRRAKEMCDKGHGVGAPGWRSTLISPTRSRGTARMGREKIRKPVRHVQADHR